MKIINIFGEEEEYTGVTKAPRFRPRIQYMPEMIRGEYNEMLKVNDKLYEENYQKNVLLQKRFSKNFIERWLKDDKTLDK